MTATTACAAGRAHLHAVRHSRVPGTRAGHADGAQPRRGLVRALPPGAASGGMRGLSQRKDRPPQGSPLRCRCPAHPANRAPSPAGGLWACCCLRWWRATRPFARRTGWPCFGPSAGRSTRRPNTFQRWVQPGGGWTAVLSTCWMGPGAEGGMRPQQAPAGAGHPRTFHRPGLPTCLPQPPPSRHHPPPQELKDLVKRLLVRQTSRRIGCASAGVSEVKQHPWFKCGAGGRGRGEGEQGGAGGWLCGSVSIGAHEDRRTCRWRPALLGGASLAAHPPAGLPSALFLPGALTGRRWRSAA